MDRGGKGRRRKMKETLLGGSGKEEELEIGISQGRKRREEEKMS